MIMVSARRLFERSLYSEFVEGVVFRITMPLDESSGEMSKDNFTQTTQTTQSTTQSQSIAVINPHLIEFFDSFAVCNRKTILFPRRMRYTIYKWRWLN